MTKEASNTSGPRTVQSATRAIELLRHIAQAAQLSSLSDMAREMKLSKPAVYNLLKTLEAEGLVRKGADSRYSLTWGMYELGSSVLRRVDVTRVARIHLDTLALETGEAVLLAVLDDDSVLYLDRGQSAMTFSMVANVGRRSPLHTNASGKVLLAGQPDSYIEHVLGRDLEQMTTNTILDKDILRNDLNEVRNRGFALCTEEQELGLSSIAVPIRNHSGSVIAALTIAGPTARVNLLTAEKLVARLKVEAQEISEQLGAQKADA